MALPLLNRFFAKSSTPGEYLLLKISPSLAQAIIFKPPQELEERPRILGTGEHAVGQISFRGYQLLDYDAVLESLNIALEQAVLAANLKPGAVILLLPVGLAKPISLAVRFSRQEPESQITASELEAILAKVQEKTAVRAQEDLSKIDFLPQSLQPLNTVVTQYLLDGKKVISPIGLKGQVVELIVAHHFMKPEDSQLYDNLLSELGLCEELRLDTAFTLAHALEQRQEGGILLDLEKNITDLSFFRQGKINRICLFNLGREDLADSFQVWADAVRLALDKWRQRHQDAPRQVFVVGAQDHQAQIGQTVADCQINFLNAESVQKEFMNVYTLL